MELAIVKKADTLFVQLEGTNKLYVLNQTEVNKELQWCQSIMHKEMHLNLSGIKVIDSAGIRLLIELKKLYQNSGRKLVLKNLTKEAMELLELVNVRSLFLHSEGDTLVHVAA
ncbi:MAG: STAS domain-containing protein [Bacteroidota bacterium]|nr:MAG: STAS domain-containing protein [Bacteroidota bacterium]